MFDNKCRLMYGRIFLSYWFFNQPDFLIWSESEKFPPSPRGVDVYFVKFEAKNEIFNQDWIWQNVKLVPYSVYSCQYTTHMCSAAQKISHHVNLHSWGLPKPAPHTPLTSIYINPILVGVKNDFSHIIGRSSCSNSDLSLTRRAFQNP